MHIARISIALLRGAARRSTILGVALAVACGATVPPAEAPAKAADSSFEARVDQLVEANVRAVYAHHVLLARTSRERKSDLRCYAAGTLSDDDLRAITLHLKALLESDTSAVIAWASGGPSVFSPSRDLEPILHAPLPIPEDAPVNVMTRYLARTAAMPPGRVRSVASLYATVLEVERDGDVLQQQIDFYAALKLPVYVGQLGLPGSDADFLVAGEELAKKTCASPFDLDAAAFQIAGRKLWNWGEKHLHIRDADTVAKELMSDPEVKAQIPALAALPPQRIAVLGHSFTMGLHWASPSSFTEIAASILRQVNPGIEVKHFTDGGLGAARAEGELYRNTLLFKPDQVLVVLLYRSEDDYAAASRMFSGFADAKARVHLFDNVREPSVRDREMASRVRSIASASKVPLLEVSARLASAPQRERFVCLDGIHMTEPYHRFMAKEWLRFLAASR